MHKVHYAYVDETLRMWGANIRRLREFMNADGQPRRPGEQPLTQAGLGLMLKPPVTQSTVARWEQGRTEPRRDHKRQLAGVLMTDVRFLFPMVAA